MGRDWGHWGEEGESGKKDNGLRETGTGGTGETCSVVGQRGREDNVTRLDSILNVYKTDC